MNRILMGWAVPARPPRPRPAGATSTRLSLPAEITVENSIPLFHAITAASDNSIEIEINSGGGNAICALGLYELLILHPRRVVATIVGRASSGAVTVAMGADVRRIHPGARILVHQAHAWLPPKAASAEALRETFADLRTLDNLNAEIVAAATGQTPETVAGWERAATTFDAGYAIETGLVHEMT